MRLLIFVALLPVLSCGPNASTKREATDTVIVKNDTAVNTTTLQKKDTVSVPGPTPLAQTIDGILKNEKGNKWHVLNDREAKWISGQFDYFIVPKRKDNPDYPYIARGDFNGDGSSDLAAVVTDETKTKYQLAIILSADEASPKILSWDEDILEDAAISAIPKSLIEGFEGGKTKKVNLKAEAINVEYFEKAAFVIYWNGSAFKRVQTGD